uniref:Uncharacterized protein n=1 Tax=Romanomermis culicivorax TaxID=13658 RepID=A0A915IPN0_ROMCU
MTAPKTVIQIKHPKIYELDHEAIEELQNLRELAQECGEMLYEEAEQSLINSQQVELPQDMGTSKDTDNGLRLKQMKEKVIMDINIVDIILLTIDNDKIISFSKDTGLIKNQRICHADQCCYNMALRVVCGRYFFRENVKNFAELQQWVYFSV